MLGTTPSLQHMVLIKGVIKKKLLDYWVPVEDGVIRGFRVWGLGFRICGGAVVLKL